MLGDQSPTIQPSTCEGLALDCSHTSHSPPRSKTLGDIHGPDCRDQQPWIPEGWQWIEILFKSFDVQKVRNKILSQNYLKPKKPKP